MLGSKPLIELSRSRVIAHVDLDAFYTQVEVSRDDGLRGRPVAVVQYNPSGDLRTLRPADPRIFPHSNGSIIAVSYEARAHGVKRNMAGQEARKLCPDLVIVQVPVAHGKADLTIYRQAGKAVADVLSRLSLCERASIDEVYLDVTDEAARRLALVASHEAPPAPASWQGMHVAGAGPCIAAGEEGTAAAGEAAGWWARAPECWAAHERLLASGAAVVAELRGQVLAELGFTCSAGVSHYKLLAKLGSGLHKPAQQTMVPACAVLGLLHDLPITKLRGLGGDFGQRVMASLQLTTCGELALVPVARLEALFGDKGPWLHSMAHGIDTGADSITQRLLPKSISCGKTFRGVSALNALGAVRHWMGALCSELSERMEEDRLANHRAPRLLSGQWNAVLSGSAEPVSVSRSCPMGRTEPAAMADDLTGLVRKWAADKPGWRIVAMHITAANMETAASSSILQFARSKLQPTLLLPPQQPLLALRPAGLGMLQPELSGLEPQPGPRQGGRDTHSEEPALQQPGIACHGPEARAASTLHLPQAGGSVREGARGQQKREPRLPEGSEPDRGISNGAGMDAELLHPCSGIAQPSYELPPDGNGGQPADTEGNTADTLPGSLADWLSHLPSTQQCHISPHPALPETATGHSSMHPEQSECTGCPAMSAASPCPAAPAAMPQHRQQLLGGHGIRPAAPVRRPAQPLQHLDGCVDLDVLAALPSDIQAEVRAAMAQAERGRAGSVPKAGCQGQGRRDGKAAPGRAGKREREGAHAQPGILSFLTVPHKHYKQGHQGLTAAPNIFCTQVNREWTH